MSFPVHLPSFGVAPELPNLGGIGHTATTSYEFPRAYHGQGLAPGPNAGYFGPVYLLAYHGPGAGFGTANGFPLISWYSSNLGAYNPVVPPGGRVAPVSATPGVGLAAKRRSDERIRGEILTHLGADPRLDARFIEVHVSGGVVTLDGIVHRRAERKQAALDANAVRGVWAVHNQLRVGPTGQPGLFTITA